MNNSRKYYVCWVGKYATEENDKEDNQKIRKKIRSKKKIRG